MLDDLVLFSEALQIKSEQGSLIICKNKLELSLSTLSFM